MKPTEVPDGVIEDFTGEDDHMELGETGLYAKGTGFVDANGESFEFEEEDHENSSEDKDK